MSHFTCLVIGDDYEKQLQPYHEFECTGTDDEYVVDVDKTEELRAEFIEDQTTIVVNEQTGETFGAYDDRCYRDPTPEEAKLIGPGGIGGRTGLAWYSKDWGDGRGYRPKVHVIPEGFVKKRVLTSTLLTFSQWLQNDWKVLRQGEKRSSVHKYGFVELDVTGEVVRCVDRTNPNAKWDGYQIGGRWNGFFLDHNGKERDQLRLHEVDIESTRAAAAKDAAEKFDAWAEMFEEHGRPLAWSIFLTRHKNNPDTYPINEARNDYHQQPAIAAFKHWRCPVEMFGFDREAHVLRARAKALVTFAVVKDGKWYERGEMGWWGVVHNESDQDEWIAQFNALLSDLPPDTLLTAVDCHI